MRALLEARLRSDLISKVALFLFYPFTQDKSLKTAHLNVFTQLSHNTLNQLFDRNILVFNKGLV